MGTLCLSGINVRTRRAGECDGSWRTIVIPDDSFLFHVHILSCAFQVVAGVDFRKKGKRQAALLEQR